MERRIAFGVVCVLAVLLMACAPCQETPPATATGGQSPQAFFTTKDIVNSLSVGLANGVIDFVKGQQHLRLLVEWDLFPEPKNPLEPLTWDDTGKPVVIRVADPPQDAAEAPLAARLKPEDRQRLIRAGVLEGSGSDDALPDADYKDLKKLPALPIEPSDIQRAAIERNWVQWLLRDTAGANCSLTVERQNSVLYPKGKEKRTPFTWVITQFRRAVPGHGAVYRYRLKALLPPRDVYFPGTSTEPVDVHVGFVWRPLKDQRPVIRAFAVACQVMSANPSPALSPEEAGRLESKEVPDNQFSATIKYATGMDIGKAASTALFGAFPNAKVVSGALIGDGRVDEVVGLNVPIREVALEDLEAGITMGVVPESESALYLGPYLRSGPVMLGGGVRLRADEPAEGASQSPTNSDSTISGKLTGLVALDLTQVFGEDPKPLKVDTSKLGGWTLADDIWGGQTTLVRIRSKLSSGKLPMCTVRFTDPETTEEATFELPRRDSRFVPPGDWTLEVDPPKWEILDGKGQLLPKVTLVAGQSVQDLFLAGKNSP